MYVRANRVTRHESLLPVFVHQILQALQGNVTAENMARYLAPRAQTGGLHAVAMDFKQSTLYVANARYPLLGNGTRFDEQDSAFNRQFVRLDMNELFEPF